MKKKRKIVNLDEVFCSLSNKIREMDGEIKFLFPEFNKAKYRSSWNGGELVIKCPFYSKKTSSFSFNITKQLFYCFECGASGSVIDLYRKLRYKKEISFFRAVVELAEIFKIPVKFQNW